MNITDLLNQPSSPVVDNSKQPIHDDQLMELWGRVLQQGGFQLRPTTERSNLTDAYLIPEHRSPFCNDTPIHIKVIGRHMNGSFRCHIGTGKASRPIRSIELCTQMRLLAVFFRAENSKSQLVSPEFIFFPTWLLHLFRYTENGSTPGRTDVRFLENAALAKEDHIYRLNNVLNTLFRFNLHAFDHSKLRHAVELANFLFNTAGLDHHNLPRPSILPGEYNESDEDLYDTGTRDQHSQPSYYSTLLLLLHAPRPSKVKPMCHNCNTKPASRRKLCVACYRYQLKHGEPRPLRLIVANRPGPRIYNHAIDSESDQRQRLPVVFYSPDACSQKQQQHQQQQQPSAQRNHKSCANCGVHETHQWYRNLCGPGHWCETCKSYYLRHSKVRPPELFVKAAKRKVDVRTLVNWQSWSIKSGSSICGSSGSSSPTTLTAPPSPTPTVDRKHRFQPYPPRSNSTSSTGSVISTISGVSSPATTTDSLLASPTTPPAAASPLSSMASYFGQTRMYSLPKIEYPPSQPRQLPSTPQWMIFPH